MKRLTVWVCVLAAAINLWAQAPEMFRYQGRLVDGTNLVNAALPMSFKLYDALSDGTLIYEDFSSVLVVDGLYSTMIGNDTVSGSLTDALTNATVYLEITIDGQTLSPRERLVSVPYALKTPAGATPAGTVVLSDTYPNPKLEAQGFSLVYDNLETDEWLEIDGAYLPEMGWEFELIAHSNQLWVYNPMAMENDLSITSDGKRWLNSSIPLENSYNMESISHNGLVYFFQTMASERGSCSTSDGQSWSTWSNNIDSSIELSDFVSFKDSLWAFAKTNTGMGLISIVMQSTNGVDWTQTSTGTWDRIDEMSGGEILTSENKIWVIASEASSPQPKIWNSSDGTNWTQSATNLPATFMSTETVFFENKLWHFSPTEKSCWNSSDDGDSWSLITTNLPVSSTTMNFDVIVHENKLWMNGARPTMSASMHYDVSWSTNGIDWNLSLATEAGTSLTGTEDGRLWQYSNANAGMDINLYIIGGPKKQDGLYYYRKD